ncbi:uncharacterized protein KIAA0513 [Galendromus occidentalis]|uniref:Uncharacterized protein KIAA0513 n=1 Tax=Galendromus occidentalis TaxID=34638 RepID=A0AAJ7L6S4_9ACAR|nr:uncharacterized protein KIAA0513 [Galendromus occidentalis]
MQQCSVAEKVQRWKEGMGKKRAAKSKSNKLERLGSSNESSRHGTRQEDGSRDSLDSGLNSLSALDDDTHRGSLNVLNSRIGSASPSNGEHDVDDTPTSVMSSIASDCEIDVSDIEEHEDRPHQNRSSTAESSCMRVGSTSSFSSGGDEEHQASVVPSNDEVIAFMETYVDNIFDNYELISQTDKAKFGALARMAQGRDAFARALNAKRVGNQRVGEGAFLSLNQSLAVILFECNEAHDWSPAKVLMNMCLTFYVENENSEREHLYTHLAPQRIWKSLTFWNCAFFEAILSERAKFNLPTTTVGGVMQVPDRESQRECLEKITFSQLATFTHNMHAFGLPLELCLEFLEKQVVIGNLPTELEELLHDNVTRLYDRLSP